MFDTAAGDPTDHKDKGDQLMKQYGMFTDAGDRKIDELVNSEDFINLSLDEVEKKLETLTRLTGPEIEPEPIFGPAGLLGIRKIYEDQCDEIEREATEGGFSIFRPFEEATDTDVGERVYAEWKARQAWNAAYRRGHQLLDILDGVHPDRQPCWGHLTDDEKVQALLDAAAKINPDVQDVADTLVATINRVKGD